MPKLKTRPPEVIRGNNGMRVNIPTSGLGIITVTRDKGGPWLKPRWVAAKKAVISWSGGNGSQTPEEAEQFGEFMLWAVRVARKLNMPHPDRWTDRDLIYTLGADLPQTHEQSLAKLEPAPKRRGPWTLPVEKRKEGEGFQCFCNQFKKFDSYVYAHMNERLTHECDKCGSKFSIKNGVVKVLKALPKK